MLGSTTRESGNAINLTFDGGVGLVAPGIL
jgi:hypothetical protein